MWSAPETELEAASEVGSLVDIKIRERNVNKHDVILVNEDHEMSWLLTVSTRRNDITC